MTDFSKTDAAPPGASALHPPLWAALRHLWRALRQARRRVDTYYRFSDLDERLMYDLGIDFLDLRDAQNGRRGDAFLRLRRMRRRGRLAGTDCG